MLNPTVNLAILASGGGSNADAICSYFKAHPVIHIRLIISNNIAAGVLNVAARNKVESIVIPKASWTTPETLLPALRTEEITHIVLAGFLLLIPKWLLDEYPGKIINIHPALLPKYGGKGMYGHHVHEKVKSEGAEITGITIHNVDEHYDKGDIILQKEISISPQDSVKDIAAKVLTLEHYHFPRTIEAWALKNV